MSLNHKNRMIHLTSATKAQKQVLANLMQLYLHELSQYDQAYPDADGRYNLGPYFDLYWTEPQRFPYLICKQTAPIGFALVREIGNKTYSVAEFFIIRAVRRTGYGAQAAHTLFDRHPGRWQVAQEQENNPAQAFWKSVIATYTNNHFEASWSHSSPKGPMQIFSTRTQ